MEGQRVGLPVQARVLFLEGFYLMCDPKASLCPERFLYSSRGRIDPCFLWVEVLQTCTL